MGAAIAYGDPPKVNAALVARVVPSKPRRFKVKWCSVMITMTPARTRGGRIRHGY
jgi:hypothetical protein